MNTPLILLVNPWIYDFAAYDLWAKPLGLLYLAGILRSRGFRLRYWDGMDPFSFPHDGSHPTMRAYGTGKFLREEVAPPKPLSSIGRRYFRYGFSPQVFQDFLESLRIDPPDAVFVTSIMTYWYPGVFEAIGMIRKVFPKVPVLLGGIYATLCTEHALKGAQADRVVRGPGESEVLKYLDSSLKLSPEPPENEELFSVYPSLDLICRPRYICMLTSRGCPYHCHYCASKELFSGFLEREPEQIYGELNYWVKTLGVTDVAFYDDALLVNGKSRIEPFLSRVAAEGPRVRFHAPNGMHLNRITPPLARMLMKSGFETLRFGYESSDHDWHARTGGKLRSGDLGRSLGYLKSAGFGREQLGFYILMGLPGQSPRQVEASIRDIKEAGGSPMTAEYSPIPGSAMWAEALKTARYDIEAEPLFHNNTLMSCAASGFTPDRIRELKNLKKGVT